MKHLKEYKLWEQSRELTTEQEGFLNRYVRGTWGINSEGLVDVEGDFDCSGSGIKSLMGIRSFYRDWETDRKSTRLNSSHEIPSRMPSSA